MPARINRRGEGRRGLVAFIAFLILNVVPIFFRNRADIMNPVAAMLITGDPYFVVKPYRNRHTHWRTVITVGAKPVTAFTRWCITRFATTASTRIQVIINGFTHLLSESPAPQRVGRKVVPDRSAAR